MEKGDDYLNKRYLFFKILTGFFYVIYDIDNQLISSLIHWPIKAVKCFRHTDFRFSVYFLTPFINFDLTPGEKKKWKKQR